MNCSFSIAASSVSRRAASSWLARVIVTSGGRLRLLMHSSERVDPLNFAEHFPNRTRSVPDKHLYLGDDALPVTLPFVRRWCCRTPGVCGTAYRPAACARLISFWSGHRRLRGCRSIRSNTSHTRWQIRKSKHYHGGQRVAYFVATQRDSGQNRARGSFTQ